MVPEISDRIVEIDRAMRWGYANALGPFEIWDALGFEATARRIELGRPRAAATAFTACCGRTAGNVVLPRRRHWAAAAHRIFRSPSQCSYRELEPRPGITVLRRSEARPRRGENESGCFADRPRRWRALLRISQQNEFHRRRHHAHGARRAARNSKRTSTPWSSATRAKTFPPARI